MDGIKKKLIIVEICIQWIICIRLITSLLELFNKSAVQDPKWIIVIMSLSFTFSELLPLSLVVYGVYMQIDWHKVADKPRCSDLSDSGRDEERELLDSEIEKSLKINPEDTLARVSIESMERSVYSEEEVGSRNEFTFTFKTN